MSMPSRLGARLVAATVVTAVPIGLGTMAPLTGAAAQTITLSSAGSTAGPSATTGGSTPRGVAVGTASATAAATVSIATLAPSLSAIQRYRVAPSLRPQVVAPRTTIYGTLALTSKAQRHRKISVSSAKGSHTWTASSLAEHDLPSAAMRAYKNAARNIDASMPGCHLPWTLLAGIGRVESDHGRYGGSVLGNDGVPRPAIVGVALNGAGPVAAIHDSDNGRFDGDTVWDRAVGPMQFIPTTWRSAGRDGDGDGVKSPNDIDDAALASAAYLCHGGRDLSGTSAERAAIFSYNPSEYYVDLVSAFAHGYATGSFVIPSPPVAPGSGDGVVHLRPDHSAAKAGHAKKHKAKARAKAVGRTPRRRTTPPTRRLRSPRRSRPRSHPEADAEADPEADAEAHAEADADPAAQDRAGSRHVGCRRLDDRRREAHGRRPVGDRREGLGRRRHHRVDARRVRRPRRRRHEGHADLLRRTDLQGQRLRRLTLLTRASCRVDPGLLLG